MMDSGAIKNIHTVAPECNRHPGFERSVPPAPTGKANVITCENHKARTCLSLDRFLRHLSVPCLLVA
jgi:hypothetical protein